MKYEENLSVGRFETPPLPEVLLPVYFQSMPFVHFMDTDWIQRIYIKGKAPAGSSR